MQNYSNLDVSILLILFCFVLFLFRFCVCFNESYHSLSSTYVRHCKSLPLKDHFWRKRGTFTLSTKITGACLYTRRSITKSFSWSYKVKATSYRLRTDLTIIEMTFLFSSCRKKKKNPDRQFSIFYDALWWKLAYIFFRNEYTAWSCSPSVLLCFVFSFYEEELMRTLWIVAEVAPTVSFRLALSVLNNCLSIYAAATNSKS